MTTDEVNKIFEWMARDIAKLDNDEFILCQIAMIEMCEKVKPIYEKHKDAF